MAYTSVASHPDPIRYCIARNSGCNTDNKQQRDTEIKWKQQYDIEKNPGRGSETLKLDRIKKRKERAQQKVNRANIFNSILGKIFKWCINQKWYMLLFT